MDQNEETVQALNMSFLDASMLEHATPPVSPLSADYARECRTPDMRNLSVLPATDTDLSLFKDTSITDIQTSTVMDSNIDPLSTDSSIVSSSIALAQKCEICNKYFRSKISLKRHLKVHDEDNKYMCKNCTTFFKTKEKLEEHSAAKHSGNHLCVTCGKTFSRKNALHDHSLRLKDTTSTYQSPSKGLFLCPFENCGKKFVRKTKYQDHLNVHSKLKPYSCDICNKQFSGSYRLNFHKRVCAGQLSFTCDVCGINLTDPNALRRHKEGRHGLKTHACLCGKHYKFYSSLYKHKKDKNH